MVVRRTVNRRVLSVVMEKVYYQHLNVLVQVKSRHQVWIEFAGNGYDSDHRHQAFN